MKTIELNESFILTFFLPDTEVQKFNATMELIDQNFDSYLVAGSSKHFCQTECENVHIAGSIKTMVDIINNQHS